MDNDTMEIPLNTAPKQNYLRSDFGERVEIRGTLTIFDDRS